MGEIVLNSDVRGVNMGAVTEKAVADFASMVALKVGCFWNWTTAGAIYLTPTIFIDREIIGQYPWRAIEVVIHEAAHHVLHPHTEHGAVFFRAYADLLERIVCPDS